MININKIKGFSTLFIVIIVGAICMSIAFSLSTSSMWSIRGSNDTKNANKAKALINACAEVVLEVMRENNSYTGSDVVVLDGFSCTYSVSNLSGSSRSISISGNVNGVIRNLNITTSTFNPLVISSWQEI